MMKNGPGFDLFKMVNKGTSQRDCNKGHPNPGATKKRCQGRTVLPQPFHCPNEGEEKNGNIDPERDGVMALGDPGSKGEGSNHWEGEEQSDPRTVSGFGLTPPSPKSHQDVGAEESRQKPENCAHMEPIPEKDVPERLEWVVREGLVHEECGPG